MFKIKSRNNKKIFGTKSTNNKTIFGGSCHTLIESEDEPSDNGTAFHRNEDPDDNVLTGVHGSSDSSGHDGTREDSNSGGSGDQSSRGSDLTGVNSELVGDRSNEQEVSDVEKRARFADAIDTIEKSKARFSKRDQLAADRVRRVQHVAGFPSDDTLIYSVMTNGIKNNPISKRDILICKDMLVKSRYMA